MDNQQSAEWSLDVWAISSQDVGQSPGWEGKKGDTLLSGTLHLCICPAHQCEGYSWLSQPAAFVLTFTHATIWRQNPQHYFLLILIHPALSFQNLENISALYCFIFHSYSMLKSYICGRLHFERTCHGSSK